MIGYRERAGCKMRVRRSYKLHDGGTFDVVRGGAYSISVR